MIHTRLLRFVSTDLGIQLLTLNHACDYPSSRPSELSASLVVPVDKLARQGPWAVDCEGCYDVPGVLRLQKQAFFLLAYEAFVDVRCHVDSANVSEVTLHLRSR